MSRKRKKRQGHYCWVSGRYRANEKFSFANGMYTTTAMRERRQQRRAAKLAKKQRREQKS